MRMYKVTYLSNCTIIVHEKTREKAITYAIELIKKNILPNATKIWLRDNINSCVHIKDINNIIPTHNLKK